MGRNVTIIKDNGRTKYVRWLVPQTQHTIKTTAKCNELLQLGFTLVNNEGYTVHLGTKGNQIISNDNRKRPYRFSKPYLWQVLDTNSTRFKIIDYNKISFKLECLIVKFCNKFL